MNFTDSLSKPEGGVLEHSENYQDKKGINKTRKVPLTYYKIAREALLGQVGGKILNSQFFVKKRFELFQRINEDPEFVILTWFEKWLLAKLVTIRFEVAHTAQFLNEL